MVAYPVKITLLVSCSPRIKSCRRHWPRMLCECGVISEELSAMFSTEWLKWKSRGGGTVISGFGPLLVVLGPLLTVLDPFCPCWWSLTWILSRKNGKTVQKFNAQYAEMRLLAYRSVPLSVPCVFWKFEVRERLGLKMGGGRTVFPYVLWHFNH